MKIVGSCATVDEAIELHRTLSPDVTLMDLRLGTASGVDAIKAIRRENPDARIIVLTMYEGDEDIFRAHQAGATTYLLKDTLADDLPRIVREVHGVGGTLPPDVQAKLEERAGWPALTPRSEPIPSSLAISTEAPLVTE